MRTTPLITACAAILVASPVAAQQRFDLNAFRRLVGVSSPAVAPDGRSVAFIVNRPDFGRNRRIATLMLADVSSGTSRPLQFAGQGVSDPQWSPDGRSLAFLANEGDGAGRQGRQLWVLPLPDGEAKRLTHAPAGVQSYAWRPDGGAIAFVMQDTVPRDTGEARFRKAFEVGNNDMFREAPEPPSHIWLVSAAGGEARRLTSGKWTVEYFLPPGPEMSGLSWSPDGRSIAFVRMPTTETGAATRARSRCWTSSRGPCVRSRVPQRWRSAPASPRMAAGSPTAIPASATMASRAQRRGEAGIRSSRRTSRPRAADRAVC